MVERVVWRGHETSGDLQTDVALRGSRGKGKTRYHSIVSVMAAWPYIIICTHPTLFSGALPCPLIGDRARAVTTQLSGNP